MLKRLLLRAALIGAAGVVLPVSTPAQSGLSFKIIVNVQVKGEAIPAPTLREIFFRRAWRWGSGGVIEPIDLSLTSPVRAAFSERVLGLSIQELKEYWSRQVLSGARPPMVKGSEQDVVAFVASHPGGIGYVSEPTPLPPEVKVIGVQW